MIEKCLVKIVSNKVVCDNKIDVKNEEKVRHIENIKNKKKYTHLEGIGMNLDKYHPNIIHTLVEGGKKKIPENLKHQMIAFAKEAFEKGFNPSLFGRQTVLDKFIKTVHNIPKNKPKRKTYNKGKGLEVKPVVKEESESSSSEESETDIDDVLSEVEEDLNNGRIKEVKLKLKKYKHRIPTNYYNQIMKSIN
jgi:hypothetical protein